MKKFTPGFGHWLVLMTALALAVASPAKSAKGPVPAPAQQGQGSAAGSQQDPRALLQEMEKIQQDLLQIQEAALETNPELRKQAEALQNTLLEAMRAEGFDPVQSLNRMEKLERELQSGAADAEKRPDLIAQLRREQRQLMLAEQAALEREEVRKAREQFMNNLMAAMRKENPRTDDLMASLKDKNAQLQEIVTAQSEQEQVPGRQ